MTYLSLTREETHTLRQWRRRIGRNIQQARMQQRMRLKHCAAQVGIPMDELDLYEAGGGEVSFATLVRLSYVLATPLPKMLA